MSENQVLFGNWLSLFGWLVTTCAEMEGGIGKAVSANDSLAEKGPAK